MNMDYYKMNPEELEAWMISEERHCWADEEEFQNPFGLPDHYETGDALLPREGFCECDTPNCCQCIYQPRFF